MANLSMTLDETGGAERRWKINPVQRGERRIFFDRDLHLEWRINATTADSDRPSCSMISGPEGKLLEIQTPPGSGWVRIVIPLAKQQQETTRLVTTSFLFKILSNEKAGDDGVQPMLMREREPGSSWLIEIPQAPIGEKLVLEADGWYCVSSAFLQGSKADQRADACVINLPLGRKICVGRIDIDYFEESPVVAPITGLIDEVKSEIAGRLGDVVPLPALVPFVARNVAEPTSPFDIEAGANASLRQVTKALSTLPKSIRALTAALILRAHKPIERIILDSLMAILLQEDTANTGGEISSTLFELILRAHVGPINENNNLSKLELDSLKSIRFALSDGQLLERPRALELKFESDVVRENSDTDDVRREALTPFAEAETAGNGQVLDVLRTCRLSLIAVAFLRVSKDTRYGANIYAKDLRSTDEEWKGLPRDNKADVQGKSQKVAVLQPLRSETHDHRVAIQSFHCAELGPISPSIEVAPPEQPSLSTDAETKGAAEIDQPELEYLSAAKNMYYDNPTAPPRLTVDSMVALLAKHDVISFDIFDTAIFRAVSKPDDVFRIMGSRLGVTNFPGKRKSAEAYARTWNDRINGTREVTLPDIYKVLAMRHGATEEWEQLEKDIEIQLTRQNPYIFNVYEKLRELGKELIFTSDMYLPQDVLRAMLSRAGYVGYQKIYVSNEHGARKGDGTLQKLLVKEYGPHTSIAHVGDVYQADVVQSITAGISGVYNPDQRVPLMRENDMASLAGSFYEAVIYNSLGSGLWTEGLHYTHGFRVGGILTLGFAEFVDQLAKSKGIDKILFLGRDCDILSKVYRRFIGHTPSEYVDISRFAILMMTSDANFDDYIGRTFFRWYKESNNSKPISELLADTGFGYLIDHLEAADIEPLQFPASANEQQLRDFFWDMKSLILRQVSGTIDIAREYFLNAIGGAQNILVVDVGWTGTCIAGLRSFLQSNLTENVPNVFGALLVTSRNQQLSDAISDGSISAYVYSPQSNQDIARVVMPDGAKPQREKDIITHSVEYLFTEPKATTIGYTRDAAGKPMAIRGSNTPPNPQQIVDMQRGAIDFIERYLDYSTGLNDLRPISGYTAFQPLRKALGYRPYLYEVYKDFLYDATPVLHGEESVFERFGDLFDAKVQREVSSSDGPLENGTDQVKERILFVSPEMKYVGASKSLLRLCKIARDLGYAPIVWTARAGPFANVFEASGFPVRVIPDAEVNQSKIDELIQDNVKLVVCNTIVTDGYVRALEGKLSLVWYIREATNVPQFLRGNTKRAETLRRSSSVVVVSDYAAQAVSSFTDGPIQVVRNAVEDVSELALPYTAAKDGIIRFVQLGTVEHRKGYDVFIAAYNAMPEEYRNRSELHFAGGFINSATSFASYIFGQIEKQEGIFYHGTITQERQKIEFLSQMDVVVVASRDESCSLVALEGAMLSKPLIVTDNVGAKYMVGDDNGFVVPSGDAIALRDAFMRMIDSTPNELATMGTASRKHYDTDANMLSHRRDLQRLFGKRALSGPLPHRADDAAAIVQPTGVYKDPPAELIVSLTSHPPRMETIVKCIQSLKDQTKKPDLILLWLSCDQFPSRYDDLPSELLSLIDTQFKIMWVPGDLAPHKKYFYAMQEFPEAIVVTVDDDVQYDKELIATLYQGYLEHPDCVIAARCNLIRFRPDGTLRSYDRWAYDHQFLRETETYALLPTGIGGVLYPPGSVPKIAFDVNAITSNCLFADDLWLKTLTTANGYPVWMPPKALDTQNMAGSQVASLWRANSFHQGNDLAMKSVLTFIDRNYGKAEAILRRIQGVRGDSTFVGPGDKLDRDALII